MAADAPPSGPAFHVEVDGRKCQGHNRCIALCPEVFEADELGYSLVVRPDVGPELEERVRLAEQNCPERAITVIEVTPSDPRR